MSVSPIYELSICTDPQSIKYAVSKSIFKYTMQTDERVKFMIKCGSTERYAFALYSNDKYFINLSSFDPKDITRNIIVEYAMNYISFLTLKDITVNAYLLHDTVGELKNKSYKMYNHDGYVELEIKIKSQLPYIIFVLKHFIVKDMIILICKYLRQ